MPFTSGHKKQGGRKAGTPNRLTGEAREVARRLLSDPEYQQSLEKRLRRGEAPRVELHIWELAYGKPRADADAEWVEAATITPGPPRKREQHIDLAQWPPSDPSSNLPGIQGTEGQRK